MFTSLCHMYTHGAIPVYTEPDSRNSHLAKLLSDKVCGVVSLSSLVVLSIPPFALQKTIRDLSRDIDIDIGWSKQLPNQFFTEFTQHPVAGDDVYFIWDVKNNVQVITVIMIKIISVWGLNCGGDVNLLKFLIRVWILNLTTHHHWRHWRPSWAM